MERAVFFMGKEYIPLFLDFNETTQDLSDDECGRLIRAIVAYANDEEYENILTGGEKIAFRFLKGLVDRNAAISEKRAQARAGKNKLEQNGTNDIKTEQNESNSATKTKTETKTNTKNKNQDIQERFDRFWAVYPRHEGKQTALKAFSSLNPSEELLQTMIQAIEKQKCSDQWKKGGGQYIPHPASWIRGKRWEDEPLPGKILPAQDFPQRSYDNVQAEMMEKLTRDVAEFKAKEVG